MTFELQKSLDHTLFDLYVTMEDSKKRMPDQEIVFSRTIKAGKRIYYLDIKRNLKDEMLLSITESKKIVSGEGEQAQTSFEKHKIFLYQEDFEKFMDAMTDIFQFIRNDCSSNPPALIPTESLAPENSCDGMNLAPEIKIEIDF